MKKVINTITIIIFCCTQTIYSYNNDVMSYHDLRYRGICRQSFQFSCGAAVLATLFTYYYNISINEQDIIEFFYQMHEEQRGISFLDMKKFAMHQGFNAYGYKMNITGLIETFRKEYIPIIIHTKMTIQRKEVFHYTLLTGIINNNYFILKDTAYGNKIISLYDFISIWTGYVLLITPFNDSKEFRKYIAQKILKEEVKAIEYVSKINLFKRHPRILCGVVL